MKFIIKFVLAFILAQSSAFCSSRLVVSGLYEPLAMSALRKASPLALMKVDAAAVPPQPFRNSNLRLVQSFSGASVRRCPSVLTLISHPFSMPRRFASDRASDHAVRRIGNPCIDGI